MAGRKSAVSNGKELEQAVVTLAKRIGLESKSQVRAGRRLWGADRLIDILLTHPTTGQRLGVECKYQGVAGSAEEKIPAIVQDIASWPIPGIVAMDGVGFSKNMTSFLLASGKVVMLNDLEDWLKLHFGLKL